MVVRASPARGQAPYALNEEVEAHDRESNGLQIAGGGIPFDRRCVNEERSGKLGAEHRETNADQDTDGASCDSGMQNSGLARPFGATRHDTSVDDELR